MNDKYGFNSIWETKWWEISRAEFLNGIDKGQFF